MSNKHASGLRRAARIGGVAAAAAIALGFASAGAAHADTFVPLPDGEQIVGNHKITRTAESALISPSLAANGAGRVAWVSGTVTATVTGLPAGLEAGPTNGGIAKDANGTQGTSTNGVPRLTTGYIVGCQVDVSKMSGTLGFNMGMSADLVKESMGGNVGGTASLAIPLSAGQVKFVPVQARDIKADGTYTIQYQDAQLEVQGCGGYAQARAYTVLEVTGNDYVKTTLYGQPFSIG